ncbi:MAG: protein kinase [Gemmatimonadales bacterium]|nr:protein kinase [Gemmatimonadales bacterium]
MADLRAQLQGGLTDRYRLERELGRGGMATVFLARDLRHERPVALKVLHPELASSLGPERFQQEIRLAARLQHPHILTVHDSGEASGQLWYTMPYVEGESLRDRLRRERQLPVEDALLITREVADALDYAHRQGIVHRDIKPENILLAGYPPRERGSAGWHALVADFGVARALQGAGEHQLTGTGMSVGTPAYMSPEQGMADPALDGRSDLYSLGCVLYEMLVGETPYTGPSAQAIVSKRLMDPVPSVRRLRETVPPSVDQALQRVLAKAPADRYHTASAFASALAALAGEPARGPPLTARTGAAAAWTRWRTPLLLAGSLVAVVLVGLGVWRRQPATGPGPESTLIAVLPFQNRGSAGDDYFAEGLAEAVRGKLTLVPGLEVIASASSSAYGKAGTPIEQVGRELGVQYLLTGTVSWDKPSEGVGRVRVNPELVELGRGPPRTRWQEPFQASLQDVFEVQADIATKVAGALGAALGDTVALRLAQRPTKSLAAYDAYLRGMALYVSGRAPLGDAQRAVDYLEQAVALDSSFALAWSGLSRVASYLYASGEPSQELEIKAQTAAERALRLAPLEATAHLAMGGYHRNVKNDLPSALAHFVEGQRLAPNDAALARARGIVEVSLGRTEAGLRQLERAAQLDPRSVMVLAALSWSRLHQRQFDEALEANQRALALDSTNVVMLQLRALIYAGQGQLEAARASLTNVPPNGDQTDLVALVAGWGGYTWLLDDDQQAILFRLRPAAFNNDRGQWALTISAQYWFQGDSALARAYADTALAPLASKVQAHPQEPIARILHGLALARLGRKDAARREADEARRLAPLAMDPVKNSMAHRGAAWVYATVGDSDGALTVLDSLLHVPGVISRGMLRIDPTWIPLRNDPRFVSLAQAR